MIPRLPRSFRRRHGWEAILLGALLVWLASSLAVLPTTARTEHVRILLADRGGACRGDLLDRLKAAETRALTLAQWMREGTLSPANPEASLRVLQPWFAHSPSFSFTLLHQSSGHDLAFGRFSQRETRICELINQDGEPRSRSLHLAASGHLTTGPWEESVYDPARRPWTALAESLQTPAWAGPFVYQGLYTASAPCISYIAPVRREDGGAQGAAVVDILLQELASLLEESAPDPWVNLLLSDERGRILVVPRPLAHHFTQIQQSGQIPTLSSSHLRAFHTLHEKDPRPSAAGSFQTLQVNGGTAHAWSCSLPTLPGVQWRLDLIADPDRAPTGPLGPILGPGSTLLFVLALACVRVRAWFRED